MKRLVLLFIYLLRGMWNLLKSHFFNSGIVFEQKGVISVMDYEHIPDYKTDDDEIVSLDNFNVIVEEEHGENFIRWLHNQGFEAI